MEQEAQRHGEINVAPMPQLARFMYLLYMGLTAIRNYGLGSGKGKEEAEFCRTVADNLHTLPDLILYYRESGEEEFWGHASSLRLHVPPPYRKFWETLLGEAEALPSDRLLSWQVRWGPPRPGFWARLHTAIRRGLRPRQAVPNRPSGSARTDLAPVSELVLYLSVIKRALDAVRTLEPSPRREEAVFCGYVADALHNLPDLLLRYGDFDLALFWRSVESCRTQIAPELAGRWDGIFSAASCETGR